MSAIGTGREYVSAAPPSLRSTNGAPPDSAAGCGTRFASLTPPRSTLAPFAQIDCSSDPVGLEKSVRATLLDLDLSTRSDALWLSAVLATLAHAHGSGMPATVLRRCAPAFHPDPEHDEIPIDDFDHLLRQVRFYLRSTPETDGTTLYHLFHQSRNDHLADPDTDLTELVDRSRQSTGR